MRPPGHHVGADFYGGSCYLNNAAVAAQYLRDRGIDRVAVIDVDAHHGNGTQEIFYASGDVFYGSAHVDPGHGWFPHFVGFADEQGAGDGAGANRNLPLPPGAGDEEWLRAVEELAAEATQWGAGALVVSLGVDGAAADPNSPFELTPGGYAAIGAALGAMNVPTVLVQEGGYVLDTLGDLVLAALRGFEGPAKRSGTWPDGTRAPRSDSRRRSAGEPATGTRRRRVRSSRWPRAPTPFDVVVVGGGHNGLVAAGLLAKRGARVTVLERRSKVGGAAVTEQPWGPDFKMTALSYVMSMMPPTILRELELARHGYHIYPQHGYFVPYADGRFLQLPDDDPARRHEQIAKFSSADADAMRALGRVARAPRRHARPAAHLGAAQAGFEATARPPRPGSGWRGSCAASTSARSATSPGSSRRASPTCSTSTSSRRRCRACWR